LTPAQIASRALPSIAVVRSKSSLGSGFVVGAGLLATNLHVVAGARDVAVTFASGERTPVTAVHAYDADHDLAVLRVGRTPPPLTLADAQDMAIGEAVVTIGDPMGLEATVSGGLLSAVRVAGPTFTILQITAPIAPGSSGGPVFNERGEVVGVATATLRQGQNLNFAVPASYLARLLGASKPLGMAAFAAATEGFARREGPAWSTGAGGREGS
jgi:S1-C subfamily serine protease